MCTQDLFQYVCKLYKLFLVLKYFLSLFIIYKCAYSGQFKAILHLKVPQVMMLVLSNPEYFNSHVATIFVSFSTPLHNSTVHNTHLYTMAERGHPMVNLDPFQT